MLHTHRAHQRSGRAHKRSGRAHQRSSRAHQRQPHPHAPHWGWGSTSPHTYTPHTTPSGRASSDAPLAVNATRRMCAHGRLSDTQWVGLLDRLVNCILRNGASTFDVTLLEKTAKTVHTLTATAGTYILRATTLCTQLVTLLS